jgi:hypothetical protein
VIDAFNTQFTIKDLVAFMFLAIVRTTTKEKGKKNSLIVTQTPLENRKGKKEKYIARLS